MKKTLSLLLLTAGITLGAAEIPVDWYGISGSTDCTTPAISIVFKVNLNELDSLGGFAGEPLLTWDDSSTLNSGGVYVDPMFGDLSVMENYTTNPTGLSLPVWGWGPATGYKESLVGYTYTPGGRITLYVIDVKTDGSVTGMQQWSGNSQTTATSLNDVQLYRAYFATTIDDTTVYAGELSKNEMKRALLSIVFPVLPDVPAASSGNGKSGEVILRDIYLNEDPQQTAPQGALAGLMKAVDAGTLTDRDMVAVSGASTATLGLSLNSDTERQLKAIRNRAAAGHNASNVVPLDEGKGGVTTSSASSRYFAWVNAEGNHTEQDADGSAAGYTLSSWGGTVGTGMRVNKQLTLGLALTAMRGDMKSDAADYLKGDLDTTYLSAFASYQRGAWSHNFIGTAGTMEADYMRTVSHAAGGYRTTGDTEGTAFGLMYELSRQFELTCKSRISPVVNISYRHTKVDGYNERGADAALSVDDQQLDTVTVGMGARYAAIVGEQAFNRACSFEARALAKVDLGDRQSTTSVGFINHATRASIESAEVSALGLELGAGISVPAGSGDIFADGTVELRSDYTNINATVGYRIQF